MRKTYLYARRVGMGGTAILEIDRREAISVMKENRKCGFQLGILGGPNVDVVKRVYGEFAPFKKVESIQELAEFAHGTISRGSSPRTI